MLAKLTKEVFSYELLYELYYKMSQLEISTPTYKNPKELKSKNINWIKPELVAEMS